MVPASLRRTGAGSLQTVLEPFRRRTFFQTFLLKCGVHGIQMLKTTLFGIAVKI